MQTIHEPAVITYGADELVLSVIFTGSNQLPSSPD